MLSKAKLKLIRSLELKKNRQSEGLFVAEGPKVVGDLLPYYRPRFIVVTQACHRREFLWVVEQGGSANRYSRL